MSLRLGFHYHIPMVVDDQGQLRTPGYLGRFLDSLAARCTSLTCFMHSPRADERAQMDYIIQSSNLHWVDIGPHVSIPRRMLSNGQFSQPVREQRARLDTLLIRGPSPLLPAMARAAGDLPVALLLVGDYLAGVNDLPQPRWRKEAIRAWSYWNYRQQLAVARHALTFVNSHKLFEQLQPWVPYLVETKTTTLSRNDFYERSDTCQGQPVRLLYTGRLDRAKGLFEMVRAVAMLVQQGHDVVLDLVGWPYKNDPIVNELAHSAQEHGIGERVIYHGYKAVGPELFTYYQRADIYLIASQSSEGFPRTIWEAMAHSLPVVATRVGSIPHFLVDNQTAVFVEPDDVSALANAIDSLLRNPDLRAGLIENGFRLAQQNTLESRAEEMVNQIAGWVESQK